MIARLLAVVFYALLAVILLAFIFSNRDVVEVSLFPLGVVAAMPLYFALALVFAIGLVLGLSYSLYLAIGFRRKRARDRRLIAQLERELEEKEPGRELVA
ncbi:MAG: lipopolysaccharide assembly protein LapA domain-containing protein [Alphaproteobacteria bacterium]